MTLTCDVCGFVAKNKGGLASHLRSHKRKEKNTKSVNPSELSVNPINEISETNNELSISNKCPVCLRIFGSKAGKSIHMRRAHAEIYHENCAPLARVKARWSIEEMTLVARCELRLREEGYKGSINSAINNKFPSRSADAIKSLRKQSKYKEIINEIVKLNNNVNTKENNNSQSSQSVPPNAERVLPTESEQTIPDWAITLLDAIDISHIFNTAVFEKLITGKPDESTRKLIDSEYSAWLNANGLNNKKPKKKRQPHNDSVPTDSRRRRRFFYRKVQNHWVYDPPIRQGGKQFVGAIRCRAGVLYSKTRASRGRHMVDVKCDACLRPSSAQHMIQVCPRTHAPRVKRHNEIVEFVKSCVEKKGFKTMIEPSIRDPTLGLRKPDLIIYNDDKAYIVDATIVSDSASMDAAHEQKITYYQQPGISRWVKRCTSVKKVEGSGGV